MTMSQNVLVVDARPEMQRGPPIWEQIMGIITIHSRRVTDYDAPFILTQDGMAEALGTSRSHIAVEVQNLLNSGKVEWRLSHVSLPDGTQWFQRRRIYVPTESMTPKELHDLRALARYAHKLYGTQKCLKLASLITEFATRGAGGR
jgi:hypothetical protein